MNRFNSRQNAARIIKWYMVLLFLAISQISTLLAQNPDVYFYGPYDDFPGTYHIRVHVWFVQTPTNMWTNGAGVNLQTRADGIISKLNSVYIFFTGMDKDNSANAVLRCEGEAFFDVITNSNYNPETIFPEALEIFDFGDEGDIAGNAYSVPNKYFRCKGSDDFGPASQSENVIHEAAHCLGLSHTFTGAYNGPNDGCNEILGETCPGNPPSGIDYCYCCGDFVCDTPPTNVGYIEVSSDCSHSENPLNMVPPEEFRNYMSAVNANSIRCTDHFTPGQVLRLRTYLELAPILQDIQIETKSISGTPPSGIYGNIVVEAGNTLIIDNPIEMLPGASIRVKPGAWLKVRSTITGACGGMWRGIILEGDALASQTPASQGKVFVSSTGKIEHAIYGIDVQDANYTGEPVSGTGGGIVTILEGTFENNMTAIRFGSYAYATNGKIAANKSLIFSPNFYTTNEYRGGSILPVFGNPAPLYLDLENIAGLRISGAEFKDFRTSCAGAPLATGILSKNAGFSVVTSQFENLGTGIRADEVSIANGSFSIIGNTFSKCYRDVISVSTGSFHITSNDFNIKEPDYCLAPTSDIVGVNLKGNSTGFTFARNDFLFDGTALPNKTLVGTRSMGLGEGLGNVIFKNNYTNLSNGNEAMGYNGSAEGLLYLCNTHTFNLVDPSERNDYFVTENSTVKQVQGEQISPIAIRPTGNKFAGNGNTFNNLGTVVNYYFFNGDQIQNPDIGPGSQGVLEFPVDFSNNSCSDPEPCDPPCPTSEVELWKSNFHQNKQEWTDIKADLPFITNDSLRQVAKKEISFLRLEMNQSGSQILQQYLLDTALIDMDSILAWLSLIETYPTEYRLARHHFFTRNFSTYDQLWSQIPTKFELTGAGLEEFESLGDAFATIRPHLQSGGELHHLPQNAIDSLKHWADWCSEPGFLAQVVLLRNGIQIETDCSEVAPRAAKRERNQHHHATFKWFNAYPNPANDEIIIEPLVDVGEGRIVVFDLQGKQVLSAYFKNHSHQIVLNSSDLPSGIFFLNIQTLSGISQRSKILISH